MKYFSGSPSFALYNCYHLRNVIWGGAVIHIYGSHLRDDHTRDKLEMVNCTKKLLAQNRIETILF